ncbi:MAG: patatin family protein [Clostridia bacterium]|nr:patatin family protein [Clostridia bacterium]
MKIGLIDTGGGLRGIYACGVLDRCLELGISFDTCIGISAGSANVMSFLAGQRKKNYRFYTEYSMRKEYMSLRNFITKKSYIDLNYIYSVLSNSDGEAPMDYAAIERNPSELVVIATNALTGEPTYFDRSNVSLDNYDILKASSCLPVVCCPYFIDGIPYYDGALSDPIPLEKAFSMGCDKVVVIICKPTHELREQRADLRLSSIVRRKYPNAAEAILGRAERYNTGVLKALDYQKQGKALVVAPEISDSMGTLSRNVDDMNRLYERGMRDADAIREFMIS